LLHDKYKGIPDSVDLWLALARLETYEKARKVRQAGSQDDGPRTHIDTKTHISTHDHHAHRVGVGVGPARC
jgi:hypothetical protein